MLKDEPPARWSVNRHCHNPQCLRHEWPAIVASRVLSQRLGVSPHEVLTGVHASHDTTIHRLIRPGDVLSTSLEIVGLVARPPAAISLTRLETVETMALAGEAAHTYTECARIWNPIHTDREVAVSAGHSQLPDIILHGTANLAHGVTPVVDNRADGRPELVRRVSGRFAAMAPLPSLLLVRVWPANDIGDGRRTVPFVARCPSSHGALRGAQ
jgi:acyl dehydratase